MNMTEVRNPPKINVGDWCFNPGHCQNWRIVSIFWDKSAHSYMGGWRYNMAGHSTLDPYPEIKSCPYVEHVKAGDGLWVEA